MSGVHRWQEGRAGLDTAYRLWGWTHWNR